MILKTITIITNMRRLIILTALVSLLSCHAYAIDCPEGQNLVTRVIDGDTIEMEDGRKIRILGIDTFDKNKRMAKKQAVRIRSSINDVKARAKRATEFANKLLLNKCVYLIKDHKNKGIFDRYLRYVNIDGIDYGSEALKKGHANIYCRDKKITKFDDYLRISKFKCK